MAKAVTLKNSNSEEVYPVTDISLVNGGIYADTLSSLEPTAGYISTAMLQDAAVTAAKLDDGAVTAAKLAGKAKIDLLSATNGSFTATEKGVLIVNEQFQNNTANASCTAQIAFTGASGSTVTPRASQRSSALYTRSHVFGIALVNAGDSVTWTVNYSNTGLPDWGSDGGFSLFIPCNW